MNVSVSVSVFRLSSSLSCLLSPVLCLLLSGCVSAPGGVYPGRHLDLYSDHPSPVADGLLARADESLEAIAADLGLSVPPKRLRVYVFRTGSGLWWYLMNECPRQAGRRAACLETTDGFVIVVLLPDSRKWGQAPILEKAPESEPVPISFPDLRHELTHYLLASHFADFPPWIDEGLAQYEECGMRNAEWRDFRSLEDFGSLEELVAVPPGGQLSRRQYAQAWALVRYLMQDPRFGRPRILDYLRRVRSTGSPREHFRAAFGLYPADLEGEWVSLPRTPSGLVCKELRRFWPRG